MEYMIIKMCPAQGYEVMKESFESETGVELDGRKKVQTLSFLYVSGPAFSASCLRAYLGILVIRYIGGETLCL